MILSQEAPEEEDLEDEVYIIYSLLIYLYIYITINLKMFSLYIPFIKNIIIYL